MNISDYIALGSVVIAVLSLMISSLTSTKKYELSSDIRREILSWYKETVELLIALRLAIENNTLEGEQKTSLLSGLSAKIELGRFYFPNVDKRDGHGIKNPAAYRGYRNVVLEFLVYSYEICIRPDAKNYTDHLYQLQRLYTSTIFESLSPYRHGRNIKRYTGVDYDCHIDRADFLKQAPDCKGYFKFK